MAKKEESKEEFVNETRELCKRLGIIYAGDYPDHPIWNRRLTVGFGGRQVTPKPEDRPDDEGPGKDEPDERE